jgi:lipid-binding SYLF domain-containing protein
MIPEDPMGRIVHPLAAAALVALVGATLPARARAQGTDYDLEKKKIEVAQAIDELTTADPGLNRFFDGSYGYAVFPGVGKGGFIVGAAHGTGLVYEKGKLVGKADLKQVNVGLQAGGQSYIEVIFFQGEPDLERFQSGGLEFSGQASAVAIKEGTSASIDYSKGVAVVTKAKGGLMVEASLGGQSFEYTPLGN